MFNYTDAILILRNKHNRKLRTGLVTQLKGGIFNLNKNAKRERLSNVWQKRFVTVDRPSGTLKFQILVSLPTIRSSNLLVIMRMIYFSVLFKFKVVKCIMFIEYWQEVLK